MGQNRKIVFLICIIGCALLAVSPVLAGTGEEEKEGVFLPIENFTDHLPKGEALLPVQFLGAPDVNSPLKTINISRELMPAFFGKVNATVYRENTVSAPLFSPEAQQELEDIREAIRKYKVAPANRDFKDSIARLKSLNSSENRDGKGTGDDSLGLIPSPIDVVFLTSVGSRDYAGNTAGSGTAPLLQASGYSTAYAPATFDLRSTGKLTPVREQGQCGACWAFSSYGSLESTNLPGSAWDFSENNMKNSHGFDLSPCQGGNYLMAAAYLARWAGPVSESADPYQESGTRRVQNAPVLEHVQEISFLPSRQGALDNAHIKQAIRENGAVYSSIHWEKSYYSPGTYSYYYPGSSIQNHAIDIVGWDDTYSRFHFAVTPPGDGAFIVRNSWGEDWGERGYFYVSYYDTIIGKELIQFFPEETSNYDRMYSYDPLGWVTSIGAGDGTLYAANVFSASGNEELRAVSFYTPVKGTSYEIEVSKNPSIGPRGQYSQMVSAGTFPYAGYHTVALNNPVILEKGEKFSIIIRLTTPGYGYPLAVEYPMTGYSTQAVAHSGESFISTDGKTWTDLTRVVQNGNACIKAFTVTRKSATPTPTTTPTPRPTPTGTIVPATTPTLPGPGDTKSPTVTIVSPRLMSSFSPGDTIQVIWSARDSGGIASVRVEYSLDGGSSWILLQTATSETGTCSWKVPDTCPAKVTFRVTAFDNAGNGASASRVITVRTTAGKPGAGFPGIKTPPVFQREGNSADISGQANPQAISVEREEYTIFPKVSSPVQSMVSLKTGSQEGTTRSRLF